MTLAAVMTYWNGYLQRELHVIGSVRFMLSSTCPQSELALFTFLQVAQEGTCGRDTADGTRNFDGKDFRFWFINYDDSSGGNKSFSGQRSL